MNTCIAILFSWPMYLCTNVEILQPHLAPTETWLLVLGSHLFFVNESLVSCVSVTVTNWQTWWRLSTTILRLVCWSSRLPLHLDPPHTCLLISGIVAQNLKGSQSSNHLHQYLRKNIKFLSMARFTWRGPQIKTCKSYNYLLTKSRFSLVCNCRCYVVE
jgi:hypothetical protein